MILTVGTRGSVLALAQTNRVLKQIKQEHPEVEFKLKIIKTVGDKEHGKPLFTIDCKGIFEKEIDQQVVSGEIDFAVHSLKDVPIVEQQTALFWLQFLKGIRNMTFSFRKAKFRLMLCLKAQLLEQAA